MRHLLIITTTIMVMLVPAAAYAVGGCGCAHVSPRVMAGSDVSDIISDPDLRSLGQKGKLRIGIHNQFGDFNRFYSNGERMTDPRERRAFISTSVLGVDYGILDRLTLSFQLPYVIKNQFLGNPPPSPAGMYPKNPAGEDWTEAQITNFQTNVRPTMSERSARGVGDVSLSASSDVLPDYMRASGLSLVLTGGMRFPTGSIEEDGGSSMKLPQPFQLGSGHPELLAGIMAMKAFDRFSLYALSQTRIPLSRNELDYVFGKELSLALGGVYALPFWDRRIRIGGLLDYSAIEKDNVQIVTNYNVNDPKGGNRVVPYKMVADNGDVKNTGGSFLYLGPTLELEPIDNFILSTSFSVMLLKQGNGGQALAEGIFQLSAAYTFDRI